MAFVVAALTEGLAVAVSFGVLVASTVSVVAMWKSIRQKGEGDEIEEKDREIERLEKKLDRCETLLEDERGRNLRLLKRLFNGDAPRREDIDR